MATERLLPTERLHYHYKWLLCCPVTEVPLIGGRTWRRMTATLRVGVTSNILVSAKGARIAERGPLHIPDTQSSEVQQEAAKIRRLQIMISMMMSVISQDPNLTVEEASELVAGAKRAALAMFPDKEFAYDILYRPRLQRLMRERYHLQ